MVILASILQGSFLVPMTHVRRWRWENSWVVFSVLGMIVFNWALAFASVPSSLVELGVELGVRP